MIQVPVSIGELIDKLSILQVKKNKISDETKLLLVDKEFKYLNELSSEFFKNDEIFNLYNSLINTNSKLWDVEDELRVIEVTKNFDNNFIDLARKVYFTNDERFSLKNKINEITKSEIKEVKDYVKYQ
jgi:Family of unknown function (DUF6165)